MPQQHRLGLQWDPRGHVCNFVRVVELLEGDMVGDWIVEWCRGIDDLIPVPWYFTNASDMAPANGAPATERSGRPEPRFTPHPDRLPLGDDDGE